MACSSSPRAMGMIGVLEAAAAARESGLRRDLGFTIELREIGDLAQEAGGLRVGDEFFEGVARDVVGEDDAVPGVGDERRGDLAAASPRSSSYSTSFWASAGMLLNPLR